jgi:hypothetical protein
VTCIRIEKHHQNLQRVQSLPGQIREAKTEIESIQLQLDEQVGGVNQELVA